MGFTLIEGCSQSDFNARQKGSCEGIAYIYCMAALDLGPAEALRAMLKETGKVAVESEKIMKVQDQILAGLGPFYLKDENKNPISDVNKTQGVYNQGLAIQVRHDSAKNESKLRKHTGFGTLSSFFEGGVSPLVKEIVRLFKKAGKAAAQIAVQGGGKGHSMAFYWDGKTLYFFDPNDGVYESDDLDNDVVWLGNRLSNQTLGCQAAIAYAHLFK